MGKARDFLEETVSRHVDEGPCLIWPFKRHISGHASIKQKGKYVGAHRIICWRVHGAPPTPDHVAAHSCGKGHLGCVNPHHLRWATQKENAADRILHGTTNRGERNGKAILTFVQVDEIRRMRGTLPNRIIAQKYGVAHSTIGMIMIGRSWTHE